MIGTIWLCLSIEPPINDMGISSNSTENFTRPKNREDSSDLDENLTETIAATQTFILKKFLGHTGSKNTFSNFFSRESLFE